jgi:hypothetical protein
MFNETDRNVVSWAGKALDGVPVSLEPPRADGAAKGISLYLLELVQSTADRGVRRPPILMTLRYLVTTGGSTPEEAHKMLGALVVAAYENPDFEVEQEQLPLALWTALGVPPRPAFVLRVPFIHERKQKLAPPVKHPLIIKRFPLRSFKGQIVGPENIPLMNARVELPSLDLSTNTDSKGRFHFASVPDAPGTKVLLVRAKGQEFSINAEQADSEDEPLVIHLELEG